MSGDTEATLVPPPRTRRDPSHPTRKEERMKTRTREFFEDLYWIAFGLVLMMLVLSVLQLGFSL